MAGTGVEINGAEVRSALRGRSTQPVLTCFRRPSISGHLNRALLLCTPLFSKTPATRPSTPANCCTSTPPHAAVNFQRAGKHSGPPPFHSFPLLIRTQNGQFCRRGGAIPTDFISNRRKSAPTLSHSASTLLRLCPTPADSRAFQIETIVAVVGGQAEALIEHTSAHPPIPGVPLYPIARIRNDRDTVILTTDRDNSSSPIAVAMLLNLHRDDVGTIILN